VTITSEDELEKLKAIGRICALVMEAMAGALRPGITTAELDDIGARLLDEHGARSAPKVTYDFPGATCISVNEEVAHGIPGNRVIAAGDLVNIDVSAEKDGIFADTGASYVVPPVSDVLMRLTRDGRKAMWAGIRKVEAGKPFADIGNAIGKFAKANKYSLITNLASHGIGYSLHDKPETIPTWPDRRERRVMNDGLVFTIEPFLSFGAINAVDSDLDDGWTLVSYPRAFTVQYEHTVVATKRGPLVVTLAG
jgi:methionyl aminopeptidase